MRTNKKEASSLPTWASTTDSTCNALGEGEGFFCSFLISFATKVVIFQYLVGTLS